jgi:hypothetical protein
MRRRLGFFLLLASAGFSPLSSRGDVIHGFQTLSPTYVQDQGSIFGEYGLDFATQTVVPLSSGSADIYFFEYYRNGQEWVATKNGHGGDVETPLVDLTTAPEVLSWGELESPAPLDRTFVVKSGDGLYAKFAVRTVDSEGCCSVSIEYYIQTDGTPYFGPALAVEASTWGRVKALYR